MPLHQLFFYGLDHEVRTEQDVVDAIEVYTFNHVNEAYAYTIYDAICVYLDTLSDDQNTTRPLMDDVVWDLADNKKALSSRFEHACEVLFEHGYYVQLRVIKGGQQRVKNQKLVAALSQAIWAIDDDQPFEGYWERFVR